MTTAVPATSPTPGSEPSGTRRGLGAFPAWAAILALCIVHATAIWVASGGWAEIRSDWPIAYHDHPVHFHSASIARDLFGSTRTNSGYDPSFMAGYPKSLIFPQSSTIYDLAGLISGPDRAAIASKLLTFVGTAALPVLLAWAALWFGLRPAATAWAVLLALIYFWTDGGGAGFPLKYAYYGMIAYLLAVPLGLLAVAALGRFLTRGGLGRWLAAAWLAALAWLVHVTIPMVVAPAGLAAYLAAIAGARKEGRRLGWRRQLGVWLIPVFAAVVNVFWWWPGVLLSGLMEGTSAAFYNDNQNDPVVWRLAAIFWKDASILAVLVALFVPGIVAIWRRSSIQAAAVLGFAAAGFGWGYLAGFARTFDVLQPGRHTYALGLACALTGGMLLGEVMARLRPGRGRLDLWATLAVLAIGVRLFGPGFMATTPARLGFRGLPPFLSSRPPERLTWVLDRITERLKPGARIFYEEGGEEPPGVPDPFQGGRFSGLLPSLTGVELIGGPYLKASIATNYAQFGGGKFLGKADWTRAQFVRAAEIYRPAAIVCWSPKAVAFCKANPDLITIEESDVRDLSVSDPVTQQLGLAKSELIFGTVKGYGGPTSRGRASVTASPGRLVVRGAEADEVDGLVVLRYHSVPFLKARPPVRLEEVRLGDDPVPFIGFRPPPGAFTLELDFPP